MRLLQTKLWAVLLVGAFLILWCTSVGVTLGAQQEPANEVMESASLSSGTEAIGIAGWCLVGLGFLGVALTVAFGGKPRRRRPMTRASAAPRKPEKMARSAYRSTPVYYHYHRNVQRRR